MPALFPVTLRQPTCKGPMMPNNVSNVTVPVGFSPSGPLCTSNV